MLFRKTLYFIWLMSGPCSLVLIEIWWSSVCIWTVVYKIKFKVCKSEHHHTIPKNQPTRCNNFPSLLLWRLCTAHHVSGVLTPETCWAVHKRQV